MFNYATNTKVQEIINTTTDGEKKNIEKVWIIK